MENQKKEEDKASSNSTGSRAAGSTDAACSRHSAGCRRGTWLTSSRFTGVLETIEVTNMGLNEGSQVLGSEGFEGAVFSDRFLTAASTKTREVMYTSGERAQICEQRGHGLGATIMPSTMVTHAAREVLQQTSPHQLAAQAYNKAEGGGKVTATDSKLTPPLTRKSAPAECLSSSLEGQLVRDEESKATVTKGKYGGRGGSEEYTFFSDSESTTVSSSRRSSGLSQVDGTAKCLEELVAYAEEELAEQHLHFERLQSFCEVTADEDYEFAPFNCHLGFSTTWNRETDDVLPSQCCTSASAGHLKLHNLCSSEELSCARSNKFSRPPYDGVDFLVSPRPTVVGGATHVFDEEAVAKNVDWLKSSTDKDVQMVSSTTSNASKSGFTDARGAQNLVVAAAASVFTGLEKNITLVEGPSCISCGHSMSCSRCYTRMDVLFNGLATSENPDASLHLAYSRPSSGIPHACGSAGDKRSSFGVDELANSEMNGFIISGGCRGCASNIYCLTCLEHMQEQTAGLHAVSESRILQATLRHGSGEQGSSGEVGTLPAVKKALSHPRFAIGQEGEEEVLRVLVRPQRLPGFLHGVCTNITLTSGKRDTGLSRKVNSCLAIQDVAEGYRMRTRDETTPVIGRQNGEAWAMCTTCHLLLDTGLVRHVSLTDCDVPHSTASFLSMTGGHLKALRIDLWKDIIGMTCGVPVRGVKGNQKAKQELKKHQYFASQSPSPHESRTVLKWGPSHLLQPQQRFRVVGMSENGFVRPVFKSFNAGLTHIEDGSQLVLGASCTVEVRSYAERTERPAFECGKVSHPKQLFFDELSEEQRGRTCLTRRREIGAHLFCGARELHGRGREASEVQYCGTNTCVRALPQCSDEACLRKLKRKRVAEGSDGRERSMSLSLVGNQDSICRIASGATGCFSLVREQKMKTVVPAVLVQRRGRVGDGTSLNPSGLRAELSAHTLHVPLTFESLSVQGPWNEDCARKLHQLALRKYKMSSSSVAAGQPVEVDTCFSSHMFQCPQDTKLPHGCQGRSGCSSPTRLHVPSRALQAGRADEGVGRKAVATASRVEAPSAVLRTRIGAQKAFTAYRGSVANLNPCGRFAELADKLTTSYSVQRWHRDNVAHVNVVSSLYGPGKCEGEVCARAAELSKQALRCEGRRTSDAENWKDCTDTKKKSSAFFYRQLDLIARNSTGAGSPEQEASKIARDEQWSTNYCQRSHTHQESAETYARDGAAATREYSALPRKDPVNLVHTKEASQRAPVFDPLAFVASPGNSQELDPTCNLLLPAFVYGGSSTARRGYPAEVLAVSPSMALQQTAFNPGVVVHHREKGRQGCASAVSESGYGCNSCSSVGRRRGFSLTECTFGKLMYCARDAREPSVQPAQVNQKFMPHRRDREGRVDADAAEAKRRRLESPEVGGSPIFTERQGELFTCSWSARLNTTTLSIGGTLSTKSEESTHDSSSARTVPYRSPVGSSRSELSDAGVRGGALKSVQPTASVWSSLSDRGHVEDDGQSTRVEPPQTANLKCRPASDGRPEPISLAFAKDGAAEKCNNVQCSGSHDSTISTGTPETDACSEVFSVSESGSSVPLTEYVLPRGCEHSLAYSEDTDACSRGHEVRQDSGPGGAPTTVGAVPAGVADRSKEEICRGCCASHLDAHRKERVDDAKEQLVSKWIIRRDETVPNEQQSTAGVACRRSPSVRMPGSVPAGVLHTQTKLAGSQLHTAALPAVKLECSPPQPCSTASADREFPAAVLPPAGTHCSSPQSCGVASASSDETVQETNKRHFTFRTLVKHHATGVAWVAEREEKHGSMGNRNDYSARDSSEAARAIPHRASRQPRYEKKNGVAHRGTNVFKVGIKQADSDKKVFTTEANDEHKVRERIGVHGCEEYFIKEESGISSTAADLSQNRCKLGRIRKPGITPSRVTKTDTHGRSLTFGTSKSGDRRFKGCKTSRAAGRKNHQTGDASSAEERDSLTETSLPTTSAPSTTVDPVARGPVSSGASLTASSVTSPAEACRRAFRRKGLQTTAGEGKKNGFVRRDMDDDLTVPEKTRRPWRTGADGKVLYDACGHKISGVWYDTGRRLWRVVFTQGERRRTKGFSLKQYGFEQARNLAVQCKLAIEAGKALREKESS